ncbi:MAG: PrsW family glutamic-type intramembrane protease [bacterium]
MILQFIKSYPFIPAFILGLIPALIWLWFWLKEDTHPEPAKMVTLSFLGGMLAVLVSLPLQKITYDLIASHESLSFVIWASIEELSKFLIVYFIALRNKVADEPIDDIMYLIVSALGFVAFENALFLIEPLRSGDFIQTVIAGNMRFIGASLVHIISSATIGIFLAFSFYKETVRKEISAIVGIILAIVLHTSFNLFIIKQAPGNVYVIFFAVWVAIILLLLIIEKIKHLRANNI